MQLGQLLIAKKLVTEDQVREALARQRTEGGVLGENLVAVGAITEDALNQVLMEAPPAPKSIDDTGLRTGDLVNLALKAILTTAIETASEISDTIKIPVPVVNKLLEEMVRMKLVESLGASDLTVSLSQMRFGLSLLGKQRANEALDQSQYVGPAPVSLDDYRRKIQQQAITNEDIDRARLKGIFDGLVISDGFLDQIGPAANSGRCLLLYGPPGNGKTTVAQRLAQVYDDIIYIPHCFEVEGQIVKVFDPAVHRVATAENDTTSQSVRREGFDTRWVPCLRPIVITGGELTIEMLDLKHNPYARFYEAPLHVKALGGTFIIDDFGRQLVSPDILLNRWIVPLENRVDYLKLHTGKTFSIPFDELVIFSTNIRPDDLMDAAFLRRIPYKLETTEPTVEQFLRIFQDVAAAHELELPPDVFKEVVKELTVRNKFGLACYQPSFITDQVVAMCKFDGIDPPEFTVERARVALTNLYTSTNAARGDADDGAEDGRPVQSIDRTRAA